MDDQVRVPSFFILSLTLFLISILLFAAVLNGQVMLSILSCLVIGMNIGAKLWSRVSLSGIRYDGKVDKNRVFAGDCVHLKTTFTNRKLLPVWLRVEIGAEGFTSSEDGALRRGCGLLWFQKVLFNWDLVSRKRGIYPLGPIRIRAGDLFGFFSSEKRLDEYALILVYPRLVPVRPLTLPRRDFFGRAGGKSAVKDPVYIQGTQDYQPGQPSRHIHWKASARHVRLQSKVFEPSSQEKVLMVLQVDQFAEADTEDSFERTIEVIASLAVNLGSQGYAVGFATNGTIQGGGDRFLQVSRHPRQVSKILETLARVQLPPGIGMLDLLRPGLRSVSTPSVISFVHHADERTRRVADYFRICGMPSTTFTYEPLRGTVNKKTAILNFRHLKEICVPPLENEGAGQSSGGPPVCSP